MEIPFDLSQPGSADSLTEKSNPPVQWKNETASDMKRLPEPTMCLSTKYNSTVRYTWPAKLFSYDPSDIAYELKAWRQPGDFYSLIFF